MADIFTIVPDQAPEAEPKSRKKRGGLFVLDCELIERLGVPEKLARQAIEGLDKDPAKSGFPQKQRLWGGRRYWPAVRAYLDRTCGLNIGTSSPQQRKG